MRMRLSSLRRGVQAVSFILFIVFFFLTIYPIPRTFPVDLLLRFDPLVSVVSTIAGRQIVVSLLLFGALFLLLSLLLGRFFCGYLCPLGTLIDLSGSIFNRKHNRHQRLPGVKARQNEEQSSSFFSGGEGIAPSSTRRIKYLVLIAVLTAAVLGVNTLHFFSPMAIVARSLTVLMMPPLTAAINGVVDLARPILSGLGLDSAAQFTLQSIYFNSAGSIVLLFGAIIIAAAWAPRLWCRVFCPSGGLLSVFSRFGMIKRITDPTLCNNCKRCVRLCTMQAIDPSDPTKTISSECTLCATCVDVCPKKAIKLGFASFGFGTADASLQVDRRNFLYSAAAGIVGATTLKASLHQEKNIEGRFIRPPGSLPEREFLSRCIRCGECMKVCKTNGLQPAILQVGFDGLWTPHLVARHGPCEEKCNVCGHVCPTQAIRRLPLEEKQYVKIGTAVIDRHRCIAWEQDKLCLICDEICPSDAIEFRVVSNFTGPFKRPFVIEEKCTGCGWCEHNCPVLGRAAIEVYSIGEERITKGSYITENKKRLKGVTENQESSYDVDALGSGGETFKESQLPPTAAMPDSQRQQQPVEELPGGFITDDK
ncbi:MAG: 4Fe-4S binding protein [Chitinivibrionales bacterium]|nr:4Fe-4S binding protein [Chitinivibrionales bacterium]